jgi:hypothetical protein
MDGELLKMQVREFTNDILYQKQLSHPPDFLYDLVLESIEAAGYKILPTHIEVPTSSMYDLAQVISQWLPEDYSGSADEIPIPQILQDLNLKGWMIIPPSS